MSTLHIANNRTKGMVGDLAAQTGEHRRFAGAGEMHMVWFAKDDDVLVLPWRPQDFYLDYVTSLTGTRRSSPRLLSPPPGRFGERLLAAEV